MKKIERRTLIAGSLEALGGLFLAGCRRRPKVEMRQGDVAEAAVATYVAPGDIDPYYLFYSGGQSGNIFIAGVPSMRHISTIPVFSPYPGTGYGFDKESKAMLDGYLWGDAHHVALSQTNGDYDGRWIFVSDNANNRMARIDLRDFKTKQILGPIPNVSGNHCSSFVTTKTEYVLAASRFSVPLPMGTYVPLEQYATVCKDLTGLQDPSGLVVIETPVRAGAAVDGRYPLVQP